MLQQSCAQPGVTILPLGGGGLVPAEELRDVLLCIFLEEELGFCFIEVLLFLDCSSFVSAFPHFPD